VGWVLVPLAFVLALLAGGLGGATGYLIAQREDSGVLDGRVDLPASATEPVERPADSVAGVAGRLLPSVVSIRVRGADEAGTGSGFVIRDDGYIVTNNHVVRGAGDAGEIVVRFGDNRSAPARVVGRSARYDLAVLKVSARNLAVVEFADSDQVAVGDPVIAIGSPLGLSGTVTSGIVSALDRPVSAGGSEVAEPASFINAIQTDAAINPGNSGGPLVDGRGRVVGVNTAIATLGRGLGGQGGSIGLGFAIPMNQAKRTAEEIIRTGSASYPIIGVRPDELFTGDGARIRRDTANGQPPVTPGGPAEKAGLRPGDVITKVGDKAVSGAEELVVAISAHAPGETVSITFQRDGRERSVSVVLGSLKG
jgi:putative serine protease PepD